MFPLLGAEGSTQQQKTPAIPFYGFVNNSSENVHEIQPECLGLYRNNNQIGVENKTSCWESETMNRHSVGPGGSEASDELSSRLFVLRRLMWIQMDRSREGTECASIFTPVCLSLPDTGTRGDTNSWMAGRFFYKSFHYVAVAYGTTVPAVVDRTRLWIKIWSFQLQTHTNVI